MVGILSQLKNKTIKRKKFDRQATNWEIFSKQTSDKGLILKYTACTHICIANGHRQ